MSSTTYLQTSTGNSLFDRIQACGSWISPSHFQLNSILGNGQIRSFEIEDGLAIRIWDCKLDNEVVLQQETTAPENRAFTLVYYITPEAVKLEGVRQTTVNKLWNTQLISSNAAFGMRFKPGMAMRAITIDFTPGWLQQHILSDVDFRDHFFQQQVTHPDPLVICESTGSEEEEKIGQLFEQQESGRFFLRAKVLGLLTDFFQKIHNRISVQCGTTLYHEEQVANAARKLLDNIEGSLPDIKQMAAELSISESTLKRHFKKIHGKNIYQYFLEKKMSYARQLLEEGKTTVTEIAYTLGYEKASQFIANFKRFYGVKPGAYRQTGIAS